MDVKEMRISIPEMGARRLSVTKCELCQSIVQVSAYSAPKKEHSRFFLNC